jgi:hypothetical protein
MVKEQKHHDVPGQCHHFRSEIIGYTHIEPLVEDQILWGERWRFCHSADFG